LPVIRIDILAEVYARYNFSTHEEERHHILEDGIESIFLRLKRYRRYPDKYAEKSRQAMKELEAVLERFYYQDKGFTKLIHAKANIFIQKGGGFSGDHEAN
jgi:hypothetical protein